MFEEYREGQKDDDKLKKHAHDSSLCGMYAKSLKEWCDDSRPRVFGVGSQILLQELAKNSHT